MSNITAEQYETLRQFQEISNIDDAEVAEATLSSVGWDLERALEAHLSGDENAAPVFVEEVAGPALRNIVMPPPIARVVMPHRGSASNGATTSRNVVVVDSDDDDADYVDADDGDEMECDSAESHQSSAVPLIPADCDDEDAVGNFIAVFEARFQAIAPFLPSFFTGSLQEAAREAFEAPGRNVSERRPLAIYIHHDKSIAANVFPLNVMCNEQVSNLLRHQYILWPWDVTFKQNELKLRDMFALSGLASVKQSIDMMIFNKDRFPLLVLITREKGVYEVNKICYGTESADAVMSNLMACVDDFTSIRLNEAEEQKERIERERIRQEQAHEYEMSLAADRARIEQREREIREQREEEERKRKETEQEEMQRQLHASMLPTEPQESETSVLNIKFRLPTGESLLRRFRSGEPLSVLFNYLGAEGYNTENYRFFNSDYPKKDVSTFDQNKTFAELKFPVREQIHVEER